MLVPAKDVEVSAAFYSKLFAWKIRTRGDGARAFDDSTGLVSGAWALGRPPAREPGILPYVMVEDIDRTLDEAIHLGGDLVTPRTALGTGDGFATFRDRRAISSRSTRTADPRPRRKPGPKDRVRVW